MSYKAGRPKKGEQRIYFCDCGRLAVIKTGSGRVCQTCRTIYRNGHTQYSGIGEDRDQLIPWREPSRPMYDVH